MKFKVEYVRTVCETYEVELEADNEYEIQDIIVKGKYGDAIDGEKLIETYSDDIEVTNIEELDK